MAPSAVERFVELPRGPARVRITGEGPPLLWSHGVFFPLDVDAESTLGHVLDTTPGFTMVRWDARGHGRTPAGATVEEHRWDALGEEVHALADALGLGRFAAGGISMGAAVTLHAALKGRERVAAMLLVAPPTAWETRPPELLRYRELLGLGSAERLAAHVQANLDRDFPAGTLPASLAAMVRELRGADWPGLSRVIAGAAGSDLPAREELATLRNRTLLRAWPHDAGHPLSTAEGLARVLPDSELLLLEGFDDEAGLRRSFAGLREAWDAATDR